MNVTLLAHTQLSDKFYDSFDEYGAHGSYEGNDIDRMDATDGQVVALSAIRTCYSANKPSEIVVNEGSKYFGSKATDGGTGTEAERLFRQIVASKHTSTLEHITFTFAVEGVSRALLAQLTRHRVGFSFSVQSQRYVKFGSGDRSGGFDVVIPQTVIDRGTSAVAVFKAAMEVTQIDYDTLRSLGVPAEDARAVLPNAAATNLVMTVNLRAALDFYGKRKAGRGAQAEIAAFAERLREEIVAAEPWLDQFFDKA